MKKSSPLLLLTLLFTLAGCSTSQNNESEDIDAENEIIIELETQENESDPEITPTNPPQTMSETNQTALPKTGDEIVVMKTSLGTIKLRLFPEFAPKTVENFVGLTKKGYYDGIIFHRVIDGFMIQGGDPTGTGRGGESLWGNTFEDEFTDELGNIPGSLSMANAGPNTNGSQFFINQVNNDFLDGRHSVFGQVFEGMDVVEKILKVEKGPGDKPVEDVVMEKVTVEKY